MTVADLQALRDAVPCEPDFYERTGFRTADYIAACTAWRENVFSVLAQIEVAWAERELRQAEQLRAAAEARFDVAAAFADGAFRDFQAAQDRLQVDRRHLVAAHAAAAGARRA